MSCDVNTAFLEQKFEEGLEMGMTDAQAETYAYECLENEGV